MTSQAMRVEEPQILPFNPNAIARVYIASKIRHAEMLKSLSMDCIHFTARWPLVCNLTQYANRPTVQWMDDNFHDIARSHAVLVYVENGEHLKGGLVEVGYALAHDKQIFLVNPHHEDYSHWKGYRSLISLHGDIPSALHAIRKRFCSWKD